MMSLLAFAHFGPKICLRAYIDDLICYYPLEKQNDEIRFNAVTVAGLTLKPTKMQCGPRRVYCLGHVLSADGTRVREDRLKTRIQ